MHVHRIIVLIVMLNVGSAAVAAPQDKKPQDKKKGEKYFREKVAPILAKNCYSCHGPKSKLRGELFLGSRAGLLKGGESGPAVNLKDPSSSRILDAINYRTFEMPPKKKLPAGQIAILTQWVKMGIPFPKGLESRRPKSAKKHEPEVNAKTKNFWSFKKVVRPAPPKVKNTKWVTNPIDNFVLARLEKVGLQPNSPAPKAQLIRRAYYDLIGLPPSAQDVQAFLRDKSPQAFEKVVDRLLKSKHYGERWGRHWLDLVRYAESNSYERDGTKPHIWRYRDYVIRSFNADKPYTQFIREQLAGDEFDKPTRDSIVATGYYRLGIWDDEPVSQLQALYDDLDDILLTTSQVFLGLTMNCARCHNHKLDPIPQQDYYRFLAFFSGFRRYGVRSHRTVEDASIDFIATSPAERKKAKLRQNLDRELNGLNRRIGQLERKLHRLLSKPEKEDFRAVEVRIDLARKYEGKGFSKRDVKDYINARKRKKKIEETRPPVGAKALVIKEIGTKPRETFVLVRGNARAKGAKVEPGFPSVLSPPQPVIKVPRSKRSSGRRLALANWIASSENPLTSRVMVNRIWQHHFGRGIVRSANNFGAIGDRPSHPKLLDWLATQFVKGGWKLKSLHKLIMLSSTYRMSSRGNKRALAKDPANNLLWRFNMRRLSAEELRDSVLAANGSLNPKMGGPSFYPIIPREVLMGQSRPGAGWGQSSPRERARRSVYIFVKRSLVVPLLADFDFADVDTTCPVRFVTTQSTQALGLLNSGFMNRQAAVFAAFVKKTAGDKLNDQVALALSRVTQRKPTKQEIDRGVAFVQSLRKRKISADESLRYFCLMMYNLNEFLNLD